MGDDLRGRLALASVDEWDISAESRVLARDAMGEIERLRAALVLATAQRAEAVMDAGCLRREMADLDASVTVLRGERDRALAEVERLRGVVGVLRRTIDAGVPQGRATRVGGR